MFRLLKKTRDLIMIRIIGIHNINAYVINPTRVHMIQQTTIISGGTGDMLLKAHLYKRFMDNLTLLIKQYILIKITQYNNSITFMQHTVDQLMQMINCCNLTHTRWDIQAKYDNLTWTIYFHTNHFKLKINFYLVADELLMHTAMITPPPFLPFLSLRYSSPFFSFQKFFTSTT